MPILAHESGPAQPNEPRYDVLIDIAIKEHRPDDVLRWYDQSRSQQKQSPAYGRWYASDNQDEEIAEAVPKSHPQRALEIYHRLLDESLQPTGESAYEQVVHVLRKMAPLMRSHCGVAEWKNLVANLRIRYSRRPKLIEMLDRLDDGPIVKSAKRRGR